jgi:hypothetical protein
VANVTAGSDTRSVNEVAAVRDSIAAGGLPSAAEAASGAHSPAVASSVAEDEPLREPAVQADALEDSCAPVGVERFVAAREGEQHVAVAPEPAGYLPWCSGVAELHCSPAAHYCWAAGRFPSCVPADYSAADAGHYFDFAEHCSARAGCCSPACAEHCFDFGLLPVGCSVVGFAADAAPHARHRSRPM